MRTLLLVELRLTPMPVGEPSSQAESGKSTQVQVPGVAWIAVGPASGPGASAGPGASGVETGASAPVELPLSLQPPAASPASPAKTILTIPRNAGASFMEPKLTGHGAETQLSRDRHRARRGPPPAPPRSAGGAAPGRGRRRAARR